MNFRYRELKKPKLSNFSWMALLMLLSVLWPVGYLLAQPRESEERHGEFIRTPNKSEMSKYLITEIIVKLKEEGMPGGKKLRDPNTSRLERRVIMRERRAFLSLKEKDFLKKELFRRNQLTIQHKMPGLGAYLVKIPPGLSLTTIREQIEEIEKDPDVEYAEPDHNIFGLSHLEAPPDDELWLKHNLLGPTNLSKLWGMEKIGMAEAWTDVTGNSSVIVAVLDSGIDYDHPDLKDNIWVNTEEEAGGDDGNGYDDDVYGVNFLFHTNPVGFCDLTPVEDPMDKDGHGTNVAGTIGAIGDNFEPDKDPLTSLVGVNWRVRLMSLKMLCGVGPRIMGKVAAAVEAIYYAVDKGAHVINASWIDIHENSNEVESLRLAIEYANLNGILFVTGAGNNIPVEADNDTNDHFPANFDLPNVITVAATQHDDQIPAWSNYGATKVHLAAPGQNIRTTGLHLIPPVIPIVDGTTMAAPHVAGCAALLQALRMETSLPLLTPLELKIILMKSGDQPKDNSGNQILAGKVIEGRRLNCHEAIHFLPVCGEGCAVGP